MRLRTQVKKHAAKIVFLALSVNILAALLPYTTLYTLMMRYGFIPSYTERIYTVGENTEPTILYTPLGDSLTAGVGVSTYTKSYPYLLALHLHDTTTQKVLLKPHAIPGATTGDAITKLLDRLISSNPNLVTILLGVNDVYKPVPPETFRENYTHILDRLTKETHATIYILSIPSIGDTSLTTPEERAYLHARTQEFNRILIELAETYHLPYIDLYTPTLLPSQEKGYYATDLFHPSAKGYAVWASLLYDHIH